jgi:hypothetical protein
MKPWCVRLPSRPRRSAWLSDLGRQQWVRGARSRPQAAPGPATSAASRSRRKTLLRHSPLLLTFYTGSWCPARSRDLQAFESLRPSVEARGVSLVSISQQMAAENAKARARLKLGFPILSDRRGRIAQLFGALVHSRAPPRHPQREHRTGLSAGAGRGAVCALGVHTASRSSCLRAAMLHRPRLSVGVQKFCMPNDNQWPGRANEPHPQGADRPALSLRGSPTASRPPRCVPRCLQLRQAIEDFTRPHSI